MNENYLGLPVYARRAKSYVFGYLKERIWSRIQGWKERMLSRARKEVMMKGGGANHPVWDVDSIMIGRYRWSQQEKDRKIHWISWEKNSPSQVYGWSGIPGHTCLQYVRAGKTGVEVDSEFRSLCARVGNDTTIHK